MWTGDATSPHRMPERDALSAIGSVLDSRGGRVENVPSHPSRALGYDDLMAPLDRVLLDRLTTALAAFPAVELAVVFGSAARGELARESDVDIAIRALPDDLPSRAALEATLGRAARRALDLLDLDAAPPLTRFEIARDGVVLLERKPHAWVDFKARAMIDWWDWAPTARAIHRAAMERLQREVERGSR